MLQQLKQQTQPIRKSKNNFDWLINFIEMVHLHVYYFTITVHIENSSAKYDCSSGKRVK